MIFWPIDRRAPRLIKPLHSTPHHSVYQGSIKRGGWLYNMKNQKKVKVPRLVRMHSDEMQARASGF